MTTPPDYQPNNVPEKPEAPATGSVVPPPLVELPRYPVMAPRRPTAVLLTGILLIVLAGMGLFGILILYVSQRLAGMTAQALPSSLLVWSYVDNVIVVLAYLLFGISLLCMVLWARKGTIIMMLILTTYQIAKSLYLVLFSKMTGVSGASGSTMQVVKITQIASVSVGIIFSLAIAGLVTYLLTRKDVVDAFEA